MPVHLSEKEFRGLGGQGGTAPAPAPAPGPEPIHHVKAPQSRPSAQPQSGGIALPAALDPSAGYWNFTALMCLALFVAYIVKKGELQSWVSILFYSSAEIPTVVVKDPKVPDYAPGTVQVPSSDPNPVNRSAGIAVNDPGGKKFLQGDPAKVIPGESGSGLFGIVPMVTAPINAVKKFMDDVNSLTKYFQ